MLRKENLKICQTGEVVCCLLDIPIIRLTKPVTKATI